MTVRSVGAELVGVEVVGTELVGAEVGELPDPPPQAETKSVATAKDTRTDDFTSRG
ncbi:hypothetical protein GCM10022242_31300 [Nocardioides panacisoli]|uniref:Uncharacterized protein n=1 Tax=Nocardioides panacisoli TaxID=627624 RepID=A0ABP7IUX0_9ACTN